MATTTVAAQLAVLAVLVLFVAVRPVWSHHDRIHRVGGGGPAGAAARSVPRALAGEVGLYPRVIRLAHSGADNGRLLASVVTTDGTDGLGAVFESLDDGATFHRIAAISDPHAASGAGLCCGVLFELPRQVGASPAGTLLWAASTGQRAGDRRMAIRIWRSDDHGRTWSYLSDCAVAADTRGLWEPELSVDALGRLVCYFSDESQAPRHSQVISRALSSDGGYTWASRTATVVSPLGTDRPGMAMVRSLPDGLYVMSYEICAKGGQYKCVVHVRTSADGWNWGAPGYLGARVQTPGGAYFEHAPTMAWSPAGGPDGTLLLVGQLLFDDNGAQSAESGRVMFTNTQDGNGPWTEVPAPVKVTVGSRYDPCSNYSSALLPSRNGHSVLEIASYYTPANVCQAEFATAPLG